MKELDFGQKASLGQFLPGDSPLHKLTPQIKLAGVMVLTVGLLFTSALLGSLFGLIMVMMLGETGKIPVRFLFRNIKPILPFLLIIAVMQLFFTTAGDGEIIAQWKRFTLTRAGLFNGLSVFLRFFALMGLLTLFTAVTPSREIGHGTENLTAPLAKIGFPAHAFSLIITITFRFIPILTGEAENLMKAQASRGALIGMGRNPVKRILSYLPLLVPLFISSLQRAEQLAEAMEARGFQQGEKRTRYISYHYSFRDVIALIVICLLSAGLFLFRLGNWESLLTF